MAAKKQVPRGSLAGEKKPTLLLSLGMQMRGLVVRGALLGDAVGGRVGLSGTDLECLELIANASQEAMTPGQLAGATAVPARTLRAFNEPCRLSTAYTSSPIAAWKPCKVASGSSVRSLPSCSAAFTACATTSCASRNGTPFFAR